MSKFHRKTHEVLNCKTIEDLNKLREKIKDTRILKLIDQREALLNIIASQNDKIVVEDVEEPAEEIVEVAEAKEEEPIVESAKEETVVEKPAEEKLDKKKKAKKKDKKEPLKKKKAKKKDKKEPLKKKKSKKGKE